jgi:predicted DNA-binding protein
MERARKINVTTMLDPTDFERLSDLSRETGKPISALIREAVKEFLKENKGEVSVKEEEK